MSRLRCMCRDLISNHLQLFGSDLHKSHFIFILLSFCCSGFLKSVTKKKLIWAESVNTASFIKCISKKKTYRQFIKLTQRPSSESSSPRQSASRHNLTLNTELSLVLSLFANFTVLTGIFRPREDRERTHTETSTHTHT